MVNWWSRGSIHPGGRNTEQTPRISPWPFCRKITASTRQNPFSVCGRNWQQATNLDWFSTLKDHAREVFGIRTQRCFYTIRPETFMSPIYSEPEGHFHDRVPQTTANSCLPLDCHWCCDLPSCFPCILTCPPSKWIKNISNHSMLGLSSRYMMVH